jgi:hypothetical protein
MATSQQRFGDWREVFRRVDRIDKVTKEDIHESRSGGVCRKQPYRRLDREHGSGRQVSMNIEKPWLSTALCCRWRSVDCYLNRARRAAPVTVKNDWHQIKPPPLRVMKPQQPTRLVLENGIILLLAARQRAAAAFDDGDAAWREQATNRQAKTGLADIFAESWRSGWNADARPATRSTIFWRCGQPTSRPGSESDADLTLTTTLPERVTSPDVLGLGRRGASRARVSPRQNRHRQAAAQSPPSAVATMSPGEIAGRESTKLAYGKDHPLARQEEYATIAAIGPEMIC